MGLFVTQPNGITWKHYFLLVYPMIAGEGKQAAYHPFTILFQQLTVGHLIASVNGPRPSAPRLQQGVHNPLHGDH